MSPAGVLFATFAVLMLLGSPITVALGVAAMAALYTVDQNLVTLVQIAFTSDVAVIWMFVIALLLFLGMFMETLAIILLATPVLLPVMTAFGVDPIHFGVVLVCCCGVGFSTPPLGENIFIASGIADTTLEDISYNALPFVFVTVGVIILCVFVPDIVLFLPRMMY